MSAVPSRPAIRRLINEVMPTDGELNAFFVDFFPKTYQLMSGGMDRITKVNLLFTRHDPADIWKVLCGAFPDETARSTS